MTPTGSLADITTNRSARALRLDGRIVPLCEIETGTRDAMFRLLGSHFCGTDRATFEADLSEKSAVILLEDDGGTLRGFSTLLVYRTAIGGSERAIVYSGDTIVQREWWGSAALPRTWIRAVRELAAPHADTDLYWLLLTSGYRTYRFLPVFFRSFYPRCDTDTPEHMATLLHALAHERFGERYHPETGTVRFAKPQVLTPELLQLPYGRIADPHIAFFLSRNPGHARGDELACLTRVHDDNLTPAGRRMSGAQREP